MSLPNPLTYISHNPKAVSPPHDQHYTYSSDPSTEFYYNYINSPIAHHAQTSSIPQQFQTNQIGWDCQNPQNVTVPRRMSTLPLIPEANNEAHNDPHQYQPAVEVAGVGITPIQAGIGALGHVSYPGTNTTQPSNPAQHSPWSSTSQHILTPQYPYFPTITTPFPSSSTPALSTSFHHATTQDTLTSSGNEHQWRNTVLEASFSSSSLSLPASVPVPQLIDPYSQTQLRPYSTDSADLMLAVHDLTTSTITTPRSQLHSYTSDRNDIRSFGDLSHCRAPPLIDQSNTHHNANPISITPTPNQPNFGSSGSVILMTTLIPSGSGGSALTSAETGSTLDPRMTMWGGGGSGDDLVDLGLGTISDRVSVNPTPTPAPPLAPSYPQHYTFPNNQNVVVPSHGPSVATPTVHKRGRRTSIPSIKTKTTPLRKKRPAQLHLPPPTTNMHMHITPSLHSAPAAPISLELLTFTGSRVPVDLNAVAQQPPRVDGWVKPENRPIPPLGYTTPRPLTTTVPMNMTTGYEPVCHPFGVLSQHPPDVDQQPRMVPRTWSAPQLNLRVQAQLQPEVSSEYIVTPGVNGLRVVPWRPQHPRQAPPQTVPSASTAPSQVNGNSSAKGTAAVPQASSSMVDIPTMPLSASSSGSSSNWPDSTTTTKEKKRKHVRKSIPSTDAKEPSSDDELKDRAVCEVCNASISRQSDLQVCLDAEFRSIC